HHRPGLRERARVSHASDAEVGDLRPALGVEEHVRRLQVAVDETTSMGMREARGEADGDRSRLVVGQGPAAAEPLLERSAGEVLALVLERVRPLADEVVALEDARGRVLAAPAEARVDLPPFPSSAMDGFALRSEDVPGTLPIAARIAAGRPAPGPLQPGTAMAIATGGVVPDGADGVGPVERVRADERTVEVPEPVSSGANVRPRGGDVQAGEVVVQAGIRLAPAQLGALAAAGIASVRCARRPEVAVLATGTELVPPGEPLEPGQVYEANAGLVRAGLEAEGATVRVLPRIVD